MRGKVVAAGHICLDITPVISPEHKVSELSELFVPGRLINVGKADVSTGGSVANTGLALKMLGNDVRLLGKVGNDEFGALVRQIAAGFGADGLLVDDNGSTSYSVVLAVPGLDRIFLHDPGANDSFCGGDIPDDALSDCALFHFGYPPIMKRMYENDGKELAEMLRRVSGMGIATSLDTAAIDPESEAGRADWEKILKNTLPFVDFFEPSYEELCFMLEREKYDGFAAAGADMLAGLSRERDIAPLGKRCLELGAKAVLIKCGTAGMYYKTADEKTMSKVGERLGLDASAWADKEGFLPCFRADRVLSATGAGDTSIAAFLTAVMMGRAPHECAVLAAAEGACAVTSYDALSGLKTIAELEEKIASGWEVMDNAR